MTTPQVTLFAILAASLAMFVWGRWRHDMVALAALLVSVAAGLVPAGDAFTGFSNPAVITVACVLVLSRGLQDSGAVDLLARRLLPEGAGRTTIIVGLTATAAALSAFMNNVAALMLLMPVGLQAAQRLDLTPGRLLMPIAFGSLLGGMSTLIGTPPNLIVSGFRAQLTGSPFGMFSFAPVGFTVAVLGVLFIGLVGWRLVPVRQRTGVEGFDTAAYLTEARVPEGAKAEGMTIRDIEQALGEAGAQVIGLVRREVRLRAPRPNLAVRADDILLLEAEPGALANALTALGIRLEEEVEAEENEERSEEKAPQRDEDVQLAELVVTPSAMVIGRSASDVDLRQRYRLNLLAISRAGRRTIRRLRSMPLLPGDVLLVQGTAEAIAGFAADYGCLPLAERALRLPNRRMLVLSVGILAAAIVATVLTVPAPVAFAGGVLAVMATRVVPPRAVYTAIDWPVIVLLACLLPVAGAMQTTGAAERLAGLLVEDISGGHPIVALTLILVVTMTLSDLMNNAATVAVMTPIAYGASQTIGAEPDAFFMAVAIGGSCAFLSPIGHQNNTLILGPGGFGFGDYWRLGLPVEILVVAVSIPMLLLVFGL